MLTELVKTTTTTTTPGKAESDSYSVSSAVESLGPSNEHFDQHEQGRKYGTQQFREPLLQCDEHSVGERSGQGHTW